MKNKWIAWIFVVFVVTPSISDLSKAAEVETKHGLRSGKVIVRQFDEKYVVTILSSEKKMFQFYGEDVIAIRSNENDLIGRKTLLKEEASKDAAAVINEPLARGLEIEVLSDPDQSEWLRIRIWGGHEGWIQKSVLTNEVDNLDAPLAKPDKLYGESASVSDVTAATPALRQGTAAITVDEATSANENGN